MNKKRNQLDQRADFVKKVVNTSKENITKTVKRLSKRLFLSEATIYRDLYKD